MNDEHSIWGLRLDAYLDRTLERGEVREVEAHLGECAACRAELAAITSLRERAKNLSREISPSRDLWPSIAARIAAEGSEDGEPVEPGVIGIARRRRPLVPWGWLAAAAVILVVVSSGATALLLRGGLPGGAPVAAVVDSPETRPVGLAAFASAEDEYDRTVALLQAELEARRSRLQPETIAAVEQNLAIIDRAIAEARAALAADPGSADLPLLLSNVYRQKVELLQQVVQMTART